MSEYNSLCKEVWFSPARGDQGSVVSPHRCPHSSYHLQADKEEVARQDADKAAAERSRREEVERQKQERLRLEQVGLPHMYHCHPHL